MRIQKNLLTPIPPFGVRFHYSRGYFCLSNANEVIIRVKQVIIMTSIHIFHEGEKVHFSALRGEYVTMDNISGMDR